MPEQSAAREKVLPTTLDALTGAAGKPWQQFCLAAHWRCAHEQGPSTRRLISQGEAAAGVKELLHPKHNATCAPCASFRGRLNTIY